MGNLVFLLFFAGCFFLVFLIGTEKTKIKKVLFSGCLIVYIIGFGIANGAVRDACTHGNCKHGWYSKKNDAEKFMALLWTLTPGILVFNLKNKEEDK